MAKYTLFIFCSVNVTSNMSPLAAGVAASAYGFVYMHCMYYVGMEIQT